MKPPAGILVTDFDGTMTRRDFYQLVRDRWWRDSPHEPWQDYRAGHLTHFEALAKYFAAVRVPESDLLTMIDSMELDPGVPEACARLQAAGWEVIVASAGCAWYIDYLLTKAGVNLPVHANPGSYHPTTGLQMRLPTQSPFFSASHGIDKAAIVRHARTRSPRVAYAGDGPPDYESSLLVPGEFRCARGWLADCLRESNERFVPFDRWSGIANHLVQSVKTA